MIASSAAVVAVTGSDAGVEPGTGCGEGIRPGLACTRLRMQGLRDGPDGRVPVEDATVTVHLAARPSRFGAATTRARPPRSAPPPSRSWPPCWSSTRCPPARSRPKLISNCSHRSERYPAAQQRMHLADVLSICGHGTVGSPILPGQRASAPSCPGPGPAIDRWIRAQTAPNTGRAAQPGAGDRRVDSYPYASTRRTYADQAPAQPPAAAPAGHAGSGTPPPAAWHAPGGAAHPVRWSLGPARPAPTHPRPPARRPARQALAAGTPARRPGRPSRPQPCAPTSGALWCGAPQYHLKLLRHPALHRIQARQQPSHVPP